MLSMLALAACGQSDDSAQSAANDLSRFVGADTTRQNSANAPQPTIVQPVAAIEQSGQPAPAANTMAQIKTYTFQGLILLPPDAYMANKNNNINSLDICGQETLDTNTAQKFCYKMSELQTHLYDSDHLGLDVWDMRDNWALVLTQAKDGKQPPRELWIDKSRFGVYRSYAELMQQNLLFLGDWSYQVQPEWPLQAYDGPGGQVIEIKADSYPQEKSKNPMLAITAVAQAANKDLWFKVNLINSLCETRFSRNNKANAASAAPSPVVMNVWYPAYRLDGNLRVPTVWFYAKGC